MMMMMMMMMMMVVVVVLPSPSLKVSDHGTTQQFSSALPVSCYCCGTSVGSHHRDADQEATGLCPCVDSLLASLVLEVLI